MSARTQFLIEKIEECKNKLLKSFNEAERSALISELNAYEKELMKLNEVQQTNNKSGLLLG